MLLPSWGSRNLTALGAARLTLSATRGLVGVITPLYLAALGYSATRLGLVFVAVAATSAVLSTVIGLLADHVGRRPFLIATPLLAAAAGVAFAFSSSAAVLITAAALGSFGRGGGAGGGTSGPHRPAEAALLAESVRPARRNDAFARLAVLSALGALGGGLLARLANGPHADPTAQYQPAFLAAAVLAAVSGLIALAIREPRRRRSAPERRGPRWPRRSWPLLWRLGLTNGLNGMAVGMFGPFVAYWFARRFGAGPAEVGTLFAAINAVTVGTIATAGPLARRFGLVSTVMVARVLQGLLLIPVALAPSFAVAGAVYCLRMVIARIGMPLRQSFVVAMAHPEERASVAAVSILPTQATNSASPLLAGYLFDELSLAAPFELGGALQAVAALLWGVFFRRSTLPDE